MRKILIILGIPIDDLNMDAALNCLEEFVAVGRVTGKTHQIATVNADFVVKAIDDPELRWILQESDMATADGMPLVWGARLLGVPLEGRVTGADLVPALAERAARNGYSIYLLGGAPGVAKNAAQPGCGQVTRATTRNPFCTSSRMAIPSYWVPVKKACADQLRKSWASIANWRRRNSG